MLLLQSSLTFSSSLSLLLLFLLLSRLACRIGFVFLLRFVPFEFMPSQLRSLLSALLAAAAAAGDEFHYETNKSSHGNATRRCRLSDCTASRSFKSHFMHLLSMLNFACVCVRVCVCGESTLFESNKSYLGKIMRALGVVSI